MKRGRFSIEEMDFMEQNAGRLSVEAIAKTLDRTVESIQEWIIKIDHVTGCININ